MTDRVAKGRLQVARIWADFIAAKALPGTGVEEARFWSGLDALVHDLGPRNRALVARRAELQGQINAWHVARKGKPHDAAAYKVRSNKVAEQFNGYTVLDTLHVNGRLTLGENTADLGGLAVAYAAMEKAYESKPRTKIDGLTPEQRFFLSYARIWRTLARPEAERTQVLTNPHAPHHWRVNGPLSNLDEFASAFGCNDGDGMVRKQEDRARLW